MYCTLMKKVNVTKTDQLTKISTNKTTNFIGIGGTNGFVQVVNLDLTKTTQNSKKKSKDDKKEKNVKKETTYSQNLQYHTSNIALLAWNDIYNKLTTCDDHGVMIVWREIEGVWETEMINNREVSYITDVKWSKQGQFLCFIYADGHAIVGTVEGNRAWGNDIRSNLYLIEWSPDGSNLLLASEESNIIILSSSGQQLGEMEIKEQLKKVKIATMSWWTNILSENRSNTIDKHLMLAFETGIICLYDNENDTEPSIIKTNLSQIYNAEWNLFGDVIAMNGKLKGDNKDAVCFYSDKGELIKMLKPPETIISFSWDAIGTSIALETQSFIYFAMVKPNYKWCYFSDTLVYAYLSEQDHHLVFWNTKTNKKNYKYVKNLIDITAKSPFCLITAKISNKNYLLILTNSIGSPVENKIINIEPVLSTINSSYAIVSNRHFIYLWQFRSNEGNKSINLRGIEISVNLLTQNLMREICFLVDEVPNLTSVYNYETFDRKRKANDPISCLTSTDNYLAVSCQSGKCLRYNLINLTTIDKLNVEEKMIKIGMSPSGKYLWTINEQNYLSIWETDAKGNATKIKIDGKPFEKKDVWSVVWSDEDELTFCFLEKNKLNIFSNLVPEEVLVCNGYLAEFNNLNITTVKLEDLMIRPLEENSAEDVILSFETRNLRDLREHIKQNMSMESIIKFVDEHSHRKLWELLCNHALNNLDFPTAEKCLIHMNDYMGLYFINRVKTIDDDNLKRAEVAQFYEDYDQAEEIYNLYDRKDLSIAMRLKLGQWDKVINLLNSSGVVQEDNMKIAYSNFAKQFMFEKDFSKAEEFYKKANDIEGLIQVWFATEEFDKLSNYIDKLPEQNELLLKMGNQFQNYGLCEEAVKCYIKYGDPKKAIDTCVLMNKWNLAVELAEKNNFFQIEGLVNKFSSILIEKNKKMDLVELYRKAHRHTDAAKILIKIAEDLKELNASPITLKKIYVIAALEMESFKTRLIDAQITNITQQTAVKNTTTLDTLITSDLSNVSDKTLSNPWKGAEAYHFYMLCQTQLYQNKYKESLKTALRLVLYEKELGAKEVYRLIALSSYLNNSFKECSKALSKLENLPGLTKNQKKRYNELAVAIFTLHRPKNHNEIKLKCPSKDCDAEISEFDIDCKHCGSNFSPCVASGQSIFEKEYLKCKRCKHKCLKNEAYVRAIKFCPLCHVKMDIINQ